MIIEKVIKIWIIIIFFPKGWNWPWHERGPSGVYCWQCPVLGWHSDWTSFPGTGILWSGSFHHSLYLLSLQSKSMTIKKYHIYQRKSTLIYMHLIFFLNFFFLLFSWSYSYIAKIQINYTISVNHRRKIFQGKTSANWKINCMSCPFLQNIQQTQKNVSYVKFWCICLFKKKEANFFKMWSFTKSWSIMGEALRNSFVISSLLLAPSLSDRLFT